MSDRNEPIDPGSRGARPISGTVFLVGAGPGDPGLLTRRAASLLRRAEVVVHDALVSEGVLALIGEGARIIDVGKRCGGRHTPQERINEILVDSAHSTRVVVRLKGGDPLVFGRGGEEALALADRGIPFEIVPGVTAAVGVSAYAGIPLTFRDAASAVTFVTGHEDTGRGEARVDWGALAKVHGTLAIYMGVGRLPSIADSLLRGGRAATTPAAVVEWGTYARQRTISGTLGDIAEVARGARVRAPALVVVGEVAALRDRLGWFDRLPLRGSRILIARSRAQPSRLARAFASLGAEVSEYPRLRTAPVTGSEEIERAFAALGTYRWLMFTSPAAVRHFWREVGRRGLDARCLGGIRIASLGIATTRALRRRGIVPEVTTRTFDPHTVSAMLEEAGSVAGERVLFPREAHVGSPIAHHLRTIGAHVEEVTTFAVCLATAKADDVALPVDTEYVVLPSSTAARHLAAGLQGRTLESRVVAIGPVTAQTALNLGFQVHAVAGDHSRKGVVAALLDLHAFPAEPAEQPRSEGAVGIPTLLAF
jgi:uroporphyrinogen III methyltransferase / synthase